jgi:tetratricopeptide (TPR) repeat protein
MFYQFPHSFERFGLQIAAFFKGYVREFTPVIAWLPLVGLAGLRYQRRSAAALLFGLFATVVLGFILLLNFSLTYESLWIISTHWIPAYVVAAILLGVAIHALGKASRHADLIRVTLAAVCTALPLLEHYEHNDRSDARLVLDYALNILNTMEPDAVYIPTADHAIFPVVYLQVVEGMRPDVFIGNKYGEIDPVFWNYLPEEHRPYVDTFLTSDQRNLALQRFIQETTRPVYFSHRSMIPSLPEHEIVNAGLLYRVVPRGRLRSYTAIWNRYQWDDEELLASCLDGDWTDSVIAFDYFFGLGRALLDEDGTRDALDAFELALMAVGWQADWLNDVGTECGRRGLLDAAELYYRQALGKAPDAAYIRRNLARTLMQRGNWQEAHEHLEIVLAERPEDYAALRLSARTLRNLGRYELAVARLDRAARLYPNNASIYREMGAIYGIDLGNAEAAQGLAEKAHRLEETAATTAPPAHDGQAI